VARETAGPILTFVKNGPTSATMGQPVQFEIVVRNVGSAPAKQLILEDAIPHGVRFLSGDPQPVYQGGIVVWTLDQLGPDQVKRYQLVLQPAAAGEIVSQTRLTLAGGLRTQVPAAALGMAITSPGRVDLGQPAAFDIHLTNTSSKKLTGLQLRAKVPAGLKHPMGEQIEADVGELPPGASKNIKLTAQAIQNGRHVLYVQVTSADQTEVRARAAVFVGAPGLAIHQPTVTRLLLDRPGELAIEVSNFHGSRVRNLVVTATLPEGLEFQHANERGVYHSMGRTVQWVLDNLPSDQTRTLTIQVKSQTAGQYTCQVSARSAEGLKAQSRGMIWVAGMSQLTLQVADRDDPLEVGRETVYEIRVQNEGNAPDANVRVVVTMPEGMAFRRADGPTTYRIDGKQLVFEPLGKLDGQGKAVFHVTMLAQTAGDRRLRVHLTSSRLRIPVMREERTVVYQ
jgi:uncharacterized repeat protein (TIGR01451 family)